MKHLLRIFLLNSFSLWLTAEMLPGFSLESGWQTILLAGFVLSLLMGIIAPILKILFIPINILTFGLFSWLINGIVLYLLTIFVPEVVAAPWHFLGTTILGITIAPVNITYAWSILIASVVLTLCTNLLRDIMED